LPAGWNVRLAIEGADPVSFVGRTTLWHMTAGLIDTKPTGLAVVDGGRVVSFGEGGPAERLSAFLADAEPFDFEALAITAMPHDTAAESASLFDRPSYDLLITYGGEPARRGT
jgi:hypothetical protein